MATISSGSQVTRLNRMNRAAQDTTSGTNFLQAQVDIATLTAAAGVTYGKSGSVIVSAAQSNASAVTVYPGLSGAVNGFIVQVERSGINLVSSGSVKKSSGSILIVGTTAANALPASGSYAMTTDDLINWIAW